MAETRSERMARSRRVIEEHGLELVRRYEAGDSLLVLAAEYDMYVGTLSTVIKRLGGTIRTHNPGLAQSRKVVVENRAEIVRRYAAGETGDELGQEFGLANATVVRLVREAGGDVRHRGAQSGRRGPENSGWRGGSYIKSGYRNVWVPEDDPYFCMTHAARPYAPEHRLVMARTIKRPLLPSETVHHINGDRLDNRLENLQLRQGRHGKGVHIRCHDCGSQNVGPVEI